MNAFMRLMSEKDFESMTINQIAEEANVNNQLLRNCMSEEGLVHITSKTALLRTFGAACFFLFHNADEQGKRGFPKPNGGNVPTIRIYISRLIK